MFVKNHMNTKKTNPTKRRSHIIIIVISTLLSRLYNVVMPSSIVYDEMYTFKFAKAYLSRTFAFDIHPPLTKMFITYVMRLFNFELDLKCEIGESLEDFYIGYIALRLLSVALFIVALLMTYDMLCSVCKNNTAMIITLFLIFEVAFHVHYSLIMQDCYIFFYQTAMLYSCVKFHNSRNNLWVYVFGASFALAVSSKHSAVLSAFPIVIWLLVDLFYIACDSQVCLIFSLNSVFMQTVHRIIATIVLPLIIYLLSFYMHFKYQNKYSDDAIEFSLRYQSQLEDNFLEEGDKYLVDRSIVTIINKENKTYLNSEGKDYEGGSKQQIVFADDEKSEKSIWRVVKIHYEVKGEEKEKDMFIRNNDNIKLVHMLTDKYLHSHHVNAPTHFDKKFREVSCYGNFTEEKTDDNDYWVVKTDTDYVMARESIIRLLHLQTGCFLAVNSNKTDGTHEVYSAVDGAHKYRDFYIEDNKVEDYYIANLPNPKVKEKTLSYTRMTFFEMFFEYHRKMINQNLIINGNRKFASRPWEWPLMRKGILYWNSFYAENYESGGKIIYLTGNYINWGISLIIFLMPVLMIINKRMLVIKKTQYKLPYMTMMMFWIFMMNYVPLFILSREMYLHNYLFSYYHALVVSLYVLSLFGFRTLYIAITCSFAIYIRNLGLMGMKIGFERCLHHNLGDICQTV